MKIVIAPNSFRGSLNAFEVADAIADAFLTISQDFELIKIPVADGGDFTGEVLLQHFGGEWRQVEVLNPVGKKIQAKFGITPDNTAIIELAEASGTRQIATSELNPLETTTFGTGQLIKAALDAGCRKLIIGLGGSATVDGGVGLLQALGVRFLDTQGNDIKYGGGNLIHIETIDTTGLDPRIAATQIIVPCDVFNELIGEKGAAKAFAPQKGANEATVEALERGMTHYALKVREQLRVDMVNQAHGAAAGGAAAGLWAFLKAQLVTGSGFILDTLSFNQHLQNADLVITAEGKLDHQTTSGKVPYEVAVRAKRHHVPVVLLAGQTPLEDLDVFDAFFSIINEPLTLPKAIARTERLLFSTAAQVGKLFLRLHQKSDQPILQPSHSNDFVVFINGDLFDKNAPDFVQYLRELSEEGFKIILYTAEGFWTMDNWAKENSLKLAFLVENGGGLFVPTMGFFEEKLPNAAELDDYQILNFGTSTDLLRVILQKLIKISNLKITPLAESEWATEPAFQRKFSEVLIPNAHPQPAAEALFQQLLTAQNLLLTRRETYWQINSFTLPTAVETVCKWLKKKVPNVRFASVGAWLNDASVLEWVEEGFWLKYKGSWEPFHYEGLNLINEEGLEGLKKAIEMLRQGEP